MLNRFKQWLRVQLIRLFAIREQDEELVKVLHDDVGRQHARILELLKQIDSLTLELTKLRAEREGTRTEPEAAVWSLQQQHDVDLLKIAEMSRLYQEAATERSKSLQGFDEVCETNKELVKEKLQLSGDFQQAVKEREELKLLFEERNSRVFELEEQKGYWERAYHSTNADFLEQIRQNNEQRNTIESIEQDLKVERELSASLDAGYKATHKEFEELSGLFDELKIAASESAARNELLEKKIAEFEQEAAARTGVYPSTRKRSMAALAVLNIVRDAERRRQERWTRR